MLIYKYMKIILILLFLTFTIQCHSPSKINNNFDDKIIQDIKNESFNENLLITYLYLKKVRFMDIIIKQAKLETGNFKSKLFKHGNNLFGMRFPRKRDTYAYKKIYNHAKYYHWTESVDDFIFFLKYNKIEKYDDYYEFLINVKYAENKDYVKVLKSMK